VSEVNWQEYYLETVEPILQMQEVLTWASERYKVGLLSNIMPGLLSSMRRDSQLPNLQYDSIIDSSEVAAIKPEQKIYEIAQERAGVPANEILLIDDSRVNLMAAERMGWHVMWFDDSRPDESVERVRDALQPAE
jgi:putative hydrolase of the HAD superfamily